jgi:hypothetical protein
MKSQVTPTATEVTAEGEQLTVAASPQQQNPLCLSASGPCVVCSAIKNRVKNRTGTGTNTDQRIPHSFADISFLFWRCLLAGSDWMRSEANRLFLRSDGCLWLLLVVGNGLVWFGLVWFVVGVQQVVVLLLLLLRPSHVRVASKILLIGWNLSKAAICCALPDGVDIRVGSNCQRQTTTTTIPQRCVLMITFGCGSKGYHCGAVVMARPRSKNVKPKTSLPEYRPSPHVVGAVWRR